MPRNQDSEPQTSGLVHIPAPTLEATKRPTMEISTRQVVVGTVVAYAAIKGLDISPLSNNIPTHPESAGGNSEAPLGASVIGVRGLFSAIRARREEQREVTEEAKRAAANNRHPERHLRPSTPKEQRSAEKAWNERRKEVTNRYKARRLSVLYGGGSRDGQKEDVTDTSSTQQPDFGTAEHQARTRLDPSLTRSARKAEVRASREYDRAAQIAEEIQENYDRLKD